MDQDWIKLGLKKGLQEVEISKTASKKTSISMYQGKVDTHEISNIVDVSIRAIYNDKYVTVHPENLSDDNINYYLDRLIAAAQAITESEPAIIYAGSKSYAEVEEKNFDFSKVPFSDKVKYLKDLEDNILTCPEVTQVESSAYEEVSYTKSLVNSKGLNLTRTKSFAYGYAVAVFKRDDDIKTHFEIKIAHEFSDLDAVSQAQEIVSKGVAKLGGLPIKSGNYPVVFSNECFSDLLAAFSDNFLGETAYRDLTKLKTKVGEKIASSNVTLIDDPLSKLANFRYAFDDQGVACRTKEVIKDGVFKGFLHNLKTAKIFNVEPTGNGFNGTSPVNLYLKPTDTSFADMIKGITKGVYITELVGLHAGVDDVSGDFSLQASGFKIEDGLVTSPVKMIVVSGNFFEMINNVVDIANDLKFSLSDIGSPSVYIKELVIAGN